MAVSPVWKLMTMGLLAGTSRTFQESITIGGASLGSSSGPGPVARDFTL